jgi:hypothetical protein
MTYKLSNPVENAGRANRITHSEYLSLPHSERELYVKSHTRASAAELEEVELLKAVIFPTEGMAVQNLVGKKGKLFKENEKWYVDFEESHIKEVKKVPYYGWAFGWGHGREYQLFKVN